MLKFTKAELPISEHHHGIYADLINQFKNMPYGCVKLDSSKLTNRQRANRAGQINAKLRKMGESMYCMCRNNEIYLCTEEYYNKKELLKTEVIVVLEPAWNDDKWVDVTVDVDVISEKMAIRKFKKEMLENGC